ncbi:unnamed protein product, partial [Sphacelaria rigidula]
SRAQRDFSTGGRLINASRGRIDSKFVQMVMFLNGSRDAVPEEIPVLSDSQVRDAIPGQLYPPRGEVELLSNGPAEGG